MQDSCGVRDLTECEPTTQTMESGLLLRGCRPPLRSRLCAVPCRMLGAQNSGEDTNLLSRVIISFDTALRVFSRYADGDYLTVRFLRLLPSYNKGRFAVLARFFLCVFGYTERKNTLDRARNAQNFLEIEKVLRSFVTNPVFCIDKRGCFVIKYIGKLFCLTRNSL